MKNVLFAITLLTSAAALAGDDRFAQLDADKSGGISAEEAKADASLSPEAFAKLDGNQDGQLSAEEFQAMSAEPAPATEESK